MCETLTPAPPVPQDPSDRSDAELRAESLRLEARSLYLMEWLAAVGLDAARLDRIGRPVVLRLPNVLE